MGCLLLSLCHRHWGSHAPWHLLHACCGNPLGSNTPILSLLHPLLLGCDGLLVLLRLLLLVGGAAHHSWILTVARMQILVDLEPVELELIPELLTLLIHDIAHS